MADGGHKYREALFQRSVCAAAVLSVLIKASSKGKMTFPKLRVLITSSSAIVSVALAQIVWPVFTPLGNVEKISYPEFGKMPRDNRNYHKGKDFADLPSTADQAPPVNASASLVSLLADT
uniref:Uncharacterized protein n=1 Tax=Glossina austeni TaxID=7395 RepID=A0A1A9UJN0_GLOAU